MGTWSTQPDGLSFDVVSRATVIEIAGSLMNSTTFLLRIYEPQYKQSTWMFLMNGNYTQTTVSKLESCKGTDTFTYPRLADRPKNSDPYPHFRKR